jgi:DNA-binding transcriptional regulator YiaG
MPTPKELRSRRIAMRLTTAEFAELLGISPETLDAWERGEKPIDERALQGRLASLEPRRSSNQSEPPG